MTLEIRHILIDGFDAQAVYISNENIEEVAEWSNSDIFRPEVSDAFLILTILGNKNPQKTRAYAGHWIVLEEIGFVVYDRHVYHERFDKYGAPHIQKSTGDDLFSYRLVAKDNMEEVARWCGGTVRAFNRPGSKGDNLAIAIPTPGSTFSCDLAYIDNRIIQVDGKFSVFTKSEFEEFMTMPRDVGEHFAVSDADIKKFRASIYYYSRLIDKDNIQEVADWCNGAVRKYQDRAVSIELPGRPTAERSIAYIGFWITYVDEVFTIYSPEEYEDLRRPKPKDEIQEGHDITEEHEVVLATISDRVRFHQVLAIVREAMHEQDVETYRLERTRMPGDSRDMNLIAEQLTRKIIDITHG